jgi:hypothetical protein
LQIRIKIAVVIVFSVCVLSRMILSSEALNFSDVTSRALRIYFCKRRVVVDRLLLSIIMAQKTISIVMGEDCVSSRRKTSYSDSISVLLVVFG